MHRWEEHCSICLFEEYYNLQLDIHSWDTDTHANAHTQTHKSLFSF
jgi:hypothetical protein